MDLIELLGSAKVDPLNLRAQVGTVVVLADVFADVEIAGDVVPLIPITQSIGSVDVDDSVLVLRLGDSWIIAAVLPPQVETLIPDGLVDLTTPASLPDDWGSFGSGDVAGDTLEVVYDPDASHSGEHVFESLCPVDDGIGEVYLTTPVFPVTPGADLRAGVFARCDVDAPLAEIEIEVYSAALEANAVLGVGTYTSAADEFGIGETWRYVGGDVTVPGGHYFASLVFRLSSSTDQMGATRYLDDFILRPL